MRVLAFLLILVGGAVLAPLAAAKLKPDVFAQNRNMKQGWDDLLFVTRFIYESRRDPAVARSQSIRREQVLDGRTTVIEEKSTEGRLINAMAIGLPAAAWVGSFLAGALLSLLLVVVRIPWPLALVGGLMILPFACTFRPFAGLPNDPAEQARVPILFILASGALGFGVVRLLRKT
jgi:hypothetical protein